MALVVLLLSFILRTLLVYYCWNWVIPSIFNLTYISMMQAVGVTILSMMLFGHNNSFNEVKGK